MISCGADEPGSMALIPQNVPTLPAHLAASLKQLVIEKRRSNQGFDLAVRDGKTQFTFFNVEGAQYDYNASARSLSIADGRLLISKEFANALGRPSDAGSIDWKNFGRRSDAAGRDHASGERPA